LLEAGEMLVHCRQVSLGTIDPLWMFGIPGVVKHDEPLRLQAMSISEIHVRAHERGPHHLRQTHGKRVRYPSALMIPLGGDAHVRPESRGKHRNNRQYRGTHPTRTLSKTPEAT